MIETGIHASRRESAIMDVSRMKSPLLVVAAGFALGLIGDLMLYQKPAGISLPILAGLFLVALFGLALSEDLPIVLGNLWLVIPLLFLAAMSAVRAAPFLLFLNVCGSFGLALLLANRLGSQPVIRLDFGGLAAALLDSGIASAILPIPLLARGSSQARTDGPAHGSVLKRVLVGLAIALPFLCLFTFLFAAADQLFNKVIADLLPDIDLNDIIGHTFLTGFLAWGAMGLLAYALTRTPEGRTIFDAPLAALASPATNAENPTASEAPASPPAALVSRFKLLGLIEASIILFSIDVLFALFVAIQFAALFGGEAFLRRQGLTYSEYARQGFFQLLAVAIITQGLILALDFITRRETGRQHNLFLLGSGLMIGMTIIILASAFMRVDLYEEAFGFTRLGVHLHVLMIWIAVMLAAFLILLLARQTRLFATITLVIAIGFTATLDLLNPDLFILRQNLARYERGEELDVGYLGSLSADVTPYLIPLLYQYGPEVGAAAGPWLRAHLDRLDARQADAGWPSYHLAYDRGYRALDANRQLIESFQPGYPYDGQDYIIESRGD